MENFIYGFLWGVSVCYWGYQWWRKKKLPYRWSCPLDDCAFEVKSSGLKSLDAFASSHERTHL